MPDPLQVQDAATWAAATYDSIPTDSLDPRRFIAWVGILAGLGLCRLACKCLPKTQPARIFLDGFCQSTPFNSDGFRQSLRQTLPDLSPLAEVVPFTPSEPAAPAPLSSTG